MMAPTHVATASIVTYGLFGFDWKVLAVASIAALLPDLDNTKSVLGRIFFPISIPLNAVLGHRTLTHSLIGLIGTSILIYLTGSVSILIAWAIGYGSHLLLDSFTPMGVPLFWPFPKSFGLGFLFPNGAVAEFIYIVAFIFFSAKFIFN